MEDLLPYLHFVVLPQVIDALIIGVALALVALGLTMIFGLLDVINLAHGDIYMLGGYAAFKKEFQSEPDLFGADTYGLFYLLKQAIEQADGTDTAKLRAAMEDASWETPQGTKKIRKGDHQAIVDMVVVKVKGNDFQTVGKVAGAEAVGPDKCDRF